MPSTISSPPLSEFPLVVEEFEIAPNIAFQRRLSSCESHGAVTVKLRESIVWFGFLDSPGMEFAECLGNITSELASIRLSGSEARKDLAAVGSAYQAILAEAQLENQSLAAVRSVLVDLASKAVLSHTRYVIERSRTTVRRHRELTDAADRQISLCEQRIVLSRLKFLIDHRETKRLCRHIFDPTVRDLQLVLDKRALVTEERRIIRETEAEIGHSRESLHETNGYQTHPG